MKKPNYTRTQVLLEPEQYQQLTELAESEGKSLSALLREMVTSALADRQQRELARAAEHLIDLYYTDGDMVGYSALDGENFPGRG